MINKPNSFKSAPVIYATTAVICATTAVCVYRTCRLHAVKRLNKSRFNRVCDLTEEIKRLEMKNLKVREQLLARTNKLFD